MKNLGFITKSKNSETIGAVNVEYFFQKTSQTDFFSLDN